MLVGITDRKGAYRGPHSPSIQAPPARNVISHYAHPDSHGAHPPALIPGAGLAMQTRAAVAQTVNLVDPDSNFTSPDISDSDESDVLIVTQDPEEVLRHIVDVFPDICPAYISKLAQEKDHDSESIIDAVLLEIENGASYPKKTSLGKRKRETDPILEVFSKSAEEFDEGDVKSLTEYFTGPAWKAQVSKIKGYRDSSVEILVSSAFPRTSRSAIRRTFTKVKESSSFKVYLAIIQSGVKDESTVQQFQGAWHVTHCDDSATESAMGSGSANIIKELHAARLIAAFNGKKALREKNEQENKERAVAEGTARDCGCCFSDEPMNRMVSCDMNPEHLFCYACARKNAEVQLGLSKYELKCLSLDDCAGHFYTSERKEYLDDKIITALDRLEQDAALREANIENLASCPFCPYAAECPPVGEDKEFRCLNPECLTVSCRLCSRVTHVPKTCEEAAADHKVSARHQIEEAMSAALIRKCNKCSTPFVKHSGCNKMTCTKPGCRNQQCYICGKSCDYNHFRKEGCPLHDPSGGIEDRHRQEAETAQEAARKRVLEENPDISEEELQIRFPDETRPARVERPVNVRAPVRRRPHVPIMRDPHARLREWQRVPAPPAQGQEARQTEAQIQERQYQLDVVRGGIRRLEEALRGRAEETGPAGDLLQFGQAAPRRQEPRFVFRPLMPHGQPQQGQLGQFAPRAQIQPPFEQAGWTIRRPPDRVLPTTAPGQRPHTKGWRPSLQKAAIPVQAGQEDELLPRASASPPVNPPRVRSAAGINTRKLYNADGGTDRAGTPRTETLKNMGQRQSQYSVQLLRRMAQDLQPYFEEISDQVSNHIRGSWVGILPPEIPASLAKPIREEIWAGVPLLVERKLEEIDRIVRDTHWEKLYERKDDAAGHAGSQGAILVSHYGKIPAPVTEDDYVALHEIIRSRDRRAPPHHEDLARQAHARVMRRLGKQQLPPRVAPFFHYGHPDGRAPQGQPSLADRIQTYIVKRRAREMTGKLQLRAREESKRAYRAVWEDDGESSVRATAGQTDGTRLSASQPGTPVRLPQAEGDEVRLLASQPAQRTWGGGSAGEGSRETPIMIDDAGAEDVIETPSRGRNVLPFRAQMGVSLEGAAGETEPPRKRGRA